MNIISRFEESEKLLPVWPFLSPKYYCCCMKLFSDVFISSHLWKYSKRAMSRCFGVFFTALGRALPTNDHATRGSNLIFGRQTASVRYGIIHFIWISEGRWTHINVEDNYYNLPLSSVFEFFETPSFWNKSAWTGTSTWIAYCAEHSYLHDIVIHNGLVLYRYCTCIEYCTSDIANTCSWAPGNQVAPACRMVVRWQCAAPSCKKCTKTSGHGTFRILPKMRWNEYVW